MLNKVADEIAVDWDHLSKHKDEIVAGFLSIGKKDGWNYEGGLSETGLRFVRYSLQKFWDENRLNLQDYQDIFESAVQAYTSQVNTNIEAKCRIDHRTNGWHKHAVTRICGELGQSKNPNGPYFEVVVNSQKQGTNPNCYPFQPHILINKEAMISRSDTLMSLKTINQSIAHQVYFSKNLLSPQKFTQQYQEVHHKAPGPNSKRLLDGLNTLSLVKKKAQTVGNCWIKQPKRSLYSILFIETLIQRPELSPAQAQRLSEKLYKKWKAFAKEEVSDIANGPGVCLKIRELAHKTLNPSGGSV